MPNANYLARGDSNAICDRCGQKYKFSSTRPEWTKRRTCPNCWDPRHPWTLPRPVLIDGRAIPDARPRPRQIDVADYAPFDMGVVGQYYITYVTNIGLQIAGSNLICSQWNMTVGGPNYSTFSETQDPIGD